MPTCPQCGLVLPQSRDRCPLDGTPLLAPRPEEFGRDETTQDHKPSFQLHAGLQVDLWLLDKLLATGSTSVVWRAVDAQHGGAVAIKVLGRPHTENPILVRRFLREIEAMQALRHPNVLPILSSGELPDGRPYLVMPHLVGGTLEERVRPGQEVHGARLGRLALGIFDGVQALHERGILHRDLKESNIGLTGEPERAVLFDLGVCSQLEVASEITAGHRMIGTLRYAAPEQFGGDSPPRPTADLYSLGVILYRLLCGRYPVEAKTIPEALSAFSSGAPPPPPRAHAEVPHDLEALTMALLQHDPERRPQTAREARAMLRLALAKAGWLPVGASTP